MTSVVDRRLPPSVFLPANTPRDLNQAITDMYRIIQRRILNEIQSGTLANRPAADGSQRFYYATDTTTLYFDA
jgi:hypothetical protein